METNKSAKNKEGVSLLVLVLIISIVVLAVATIYPPVVKAREGIAIESAAYELKYCQDTIKEMLQENNTVTNASDVTLGLINSYLLEAGKPKPVWPAQADIASFAPDTTNGPTINVILKSGVRTVTTSDITPRN